MSRSDRLQTDLGSHMIGAIHATCDRSDGACHGQCRDVPVAVPNDGSNVQLRKQTRDYDLRKAHVRRRMYLGENDEEQKGKYDELKRLDIEFE